MNAAWRNRLGAMTRRGALLAAVALSVGVGAGCGGGPSSDDGDVLAEDTVTVRPRVAIDGLIELSARTGGRLFVDEVVFHAPSVQIRNGPFAIADLIESDRDGADALFFRYALADGGGTGAVASERRWSLTPPGVTAESEVSFGFAPFEPTAPELDEVLARTGWDLGALSGYTAFVHGYVSMAPDDLSLREAKGDFRHDGRMAGDAEGDPAHGDAMAGDAEGDPAHGGEQMAGDAEGDPAHGGEEMAGDAEGDPAEGTDAAGDGEGDPAEGSDEKQASFDDDGDGFLQRPGSEVDGELIPFVLVLDGSLELGVPLVDLGITALGPDEFLPIDLRVDVNRLLPDERLADLDHVAAQVQDGAPDGIAVLEMEPRDAGRAFALDLDAAEKRTKPEADDQRLELAGDPRD